MGNLKNELSSQLEQYVGWGNTAQRPPHPKKGDIYIDDESDDALACFADGTWTVISSSVHDLTDGHSESGLTDGHFLRATGATTFAFEADYYYVTLFLDGDGSVIGTGVAGDIQVPAGVWEEWRILPDVSGSITINVWKDTYANYPPTAADVVASPAVSAATKAEATGLSHVINDEDILRFNVASATTITKATLSLKIRKT